MIKEKGGVNADVFIEFLKRLMVGATHPIFLIVDRGPAHRASWMLRSSSNWWPCRSPTVLGTRTIGIGDIGEGFFLCNYPLPFFRAQILRNYPQF
jgi:hypothetical protein